MRKKIDRFGFEHNACYDINNFKICPKCKGENVKKYSFFDKPIKVCKICGGYGEVSKNN